MSCSEPRWIPQYTCLKDLSRGECTYLWNMSCSQPRLIPQYTYLKDLSKNKCTYLWNMSCSEPRLILSPSCVSTFSLSLSSSCCVVSIQYSAVQRILQIRHCSSSVNLVTSPSFRILWISPVADVMFVSCFENLQKTG